MKETINKAIRKTRPALRLVTAQSAVLPLERDASRSQMSAARQAYYQRMEQYAHRIRDTEDIPTIIGLLDEALTDTRALNGNSTLRVAPAKLMQAERKIGELKQELEQMRALVHIDHLTGALNRSGLDHAYDREAARADRQQMPLGTALLDLDNFKQLNDRHGHQAGDAALMHFSQLIKRSMRPSDVFVRFGGEEFLLLLPSSGPEETARALCRLQNDLTCSPLKFSNRDVHITFSAGVTVRKHGEERDEVIRRADRALYSAKQAGKNRAVIEA